MRKKHLRTDTSKLGHADQSDRGEEPLGLTAPQAPQEGPVSPQPTSRGALGRGRSRRAVDDRPVLKNYRLDGADIDRLHEIVAAVNRLSAKGAISENSVLRSLILLGSKASPSDIFAAVKEVLLSRI